jgi:hypothetical protein
MATPNELFDTIFEGQRKMMDWWTEASKKAMTTPEPSKEESPLGPEYIKNWYQRQQALLEEAGSIKDPKKALEKMPEQYKKWLDLQLEFQDKWMKAYQDGWNKMGYKIPDLNGYSPDKMFQNSWKLWSGKMQESNDWIKQNILDRLPAMMQPHYRNFNGMYDDLAKSWEPFQRMIQYGIYDKKGVDVFFAPEQYQDIINKLMGFQAPDKLKDGIQQMNTFFDQYVDFVEHFAPTYQNWGNQWMEYLKQFNEMGQNPYIQTALDVNQRIKENIEPLINVMGYEKPGHFARILKDIQYAYNAYLLRNSELQQMVYQAGQNALPETIKSYYETFQESKEMPDFESFFNRLINSLDIYLTEVLESKEYSLLQAKVSQLGITVKGKLDELVELSFDQTPFLMKSHGDDLAKEIHGLRKRVRDLEKQLKEVASQASQSNQTPSRSASKARTNRAKAEVK